jgi:hypothetical protein
VVVVVVAGKISAGSVENKDKGKRQIKMSRMG